MRILVLSDSHRNKFALSQALKNQPNADIVVFLGDGEYDFDACRNQIPKHKLLKQMVFVFF